MAVPQIRYAIRLGLFCIFGAVCRGQGLLPATDTLFAAQQLEQEAIAQRNPDLLANAYYLHGKAYLARSNYLKAQAYFMKTLRIRAKQGDSYPLGQVYMRMSNMECEQDHHIKCIEYARKGLAVFNRIGSDKGRMIAYGCITNGYGKIWANQYHNDRRHPLRDTIWQYTRASERLAYKLRDSLAVAEVSLSIGNLYALDQNRKALIYINHAKDYFEKKRRIFQLSSTWVTLAAAYLSFGEPANAYEALRAGERVYRQIPNESLMDRNYLRAYTDYYRTIGNFSKAFAYSEKLRTLENNLLLSDQKGAISRLNIAYETEKKDAHIRNQQRELELRAETERSQRLLLVASLCLLLGAVVTSVAFYRLYRRNQRISGQNELLVKEQNHRVKNNLQVVSSLLNLQARRLGDETARQTIHESQLRIESMAILHRKLYENEQLARVELTEFIPELIDNVGRSFGHLPVEQQLHIEPIYLEADKATLLGLILTELLTNAWKYAFPQVVSPRLTIRATQQHNMLQLTVADNGPGWDGTTTKKTLGTRIIQAQVSQLRANYAFKPENGTLFWLQFQN